MQDDAVAVEPIALALTRPPMLLGVRYEIFALNGMVTVILFIMTSNFLASLVALPVHFIAAYLCQRDPFFFHVVEVFLKSRRAVKNARFWGGRSYSP
jgi:type IV secretion system protein VirB3